VMMEVVVSELTDPSQRADQPLGLPSRSTKKVVNRRLYENTYSSHNLGETPTWIYLISSWLLSKLAKGLFRTCLERRDRERVPAMTKLEVTLSNRAGSFTRRGGLRNSQSLS
jgi:hypothetical protein